MTADAVDVILDQWERERPDLDLTATGILGRVSRIAELVEQSMDRVFQPHGLTAGDFVVLAALRRSGKPHQLTPTALSRSMMVSSGGTTKRLDRLEARGLIRRDPDPADRRGTLVTLTSAGLATIDTVASAHVRNEKRLVATLSPNQQKTLTRLLRELLLALEHDQDLLGITAREILRWMQVRVARHTNRLAEIVRFYRDGWKAHGVTLVDPDGFRVVLVPDSWVAG